MRPNLRERMPSITGRHMLNSEFRYGVDYRGPIFRSHAVEHAVAGDARIVDQDLDRAKIGLNLLNAGGAGLKG